MGWRSPRKARRPERDPETSFTQNELREHVTLIDVANADDWDDLILDLLEAAYPTKRTQDS